MDITYDDAIRAEEEKEHEAIDYAGFWLRFWAYVIDLLVIGSLNRIIVKPVVQLLDIAPNEPAFLPLQTVFTGIVFYLYFALMTKYCQQTLGKMVLGVKVIAKEGKLTWGTILFREVIGRFISKAFFGLVYIWVGLSPRKQGVHDYFADTYVIHTRK